MDKPKILAVMGAKQSGKSTTVNFVHGIVLKLNGIIDNFKIGEDGSLVVEGLSVMVDDTVGKADVILDVSQNNNYQFALWASEVMWPFVKNYSFAEALKELAIDLFDCPRNLVYGSDKDKSTVMEHLRWENMPGICTSDEYYDEAVQHVCGKMLDDSLVFHAEGPMTIREFLQFLGTDVMRKMYEPIWVNRLIKDIVSETTDLCAISDVRFPNEGVELKKLKEEFDVKILGLTRCPFSDDSHASEKCLDFSLCDVVLDNENMTIEEQCKAVFDLLTEWEWFYKKESAEAPRDRKGTMKINKDKEEKNV